MIAPTHIDMMWSPAARSELRIQQRCPKEARAFRSLYKEFKNLKPDTGQKTKATLRSWISQSNNNQKEQRLLLKLEQPCGAAWHDLGGSGAGSGCGRAAAGHARHLGRHSEHKNH